MTKPRIIFLILLFAALAFGGFLLYQNRDNSPSLFGTNLGGPSSENTSDEGVKGMQPQKSETDWTTNELTTAAWVPYWDFSRGLETLKANPGKFDSISPVIYQLNADGSLKKTKGDTYKSLQNYANQQGIEVIPSIAMFDHDLFTKVLQDDENRQRHIDAIISEIQTNNFEGIDLDYESTKLDDKKEYQEFIQKLSARCKEIDAKLVITVLAKWGENTYYPSLRETRKVQDWKFLSEHADEIRIMAYDYTSQYSEEPGPIAPLPWIELILKKAVREIPKEKIVLGVHNYAFNWAAQEVEPENDLDRIFKDNPPTEKLKADAYTYDQVVSIKAKYPGRDQPDLLWGENYYLYTREEGSRVLVYIDENGIAERRKISKKYGIKGVSFWRLGGDSLLKY